MAGTDRSAQTRSEARSSRPLLKGTACRSASSAPAWQLAPESRRGERAFCPLRPSQECHVGVVAADELDAEGEPSRPGPIRERHARDAKQRPDPIEDRAAGSAVAFRRFAGRAGSQEKIEIAHLIFEPPPAVARTLSRRVIGRARQLPAFLQPWPQRR